MRTRRRILGSPPCACKKKKKFQDEHALGYGNVEKALALDGACLDSLFLTTTESEIKTIKSQKGKGTKEKNKKTQEPSLLPFFHVLTL